MNEVIVNGETYIKKQEASNQGYVLVRGDRSGVFVGQLKAEEGRTVVLNNARRIWYWDGAASLSQLAMEGVSKPENCKFPCELTEIKILDAIEIIPMTDKAVQSIKSVKVWEC